MTESVTITFSQAGVQPPVYVVTSLSEPPWEPLEMTVGEGQTASADPVFTRHFKNVAEGDHQYKIRVGDGHWVVDESKDSAADEHGNRNNVIHARRTEVHQSQPDKTSAVTKSRVDSTIDSSDVARPSGSPVPVVVVEKVADKEPPSYGDIEPQALPTDASKRAADAEPDFETVKEDILVVANPSMSPTLLDELAVLPEDHVEPGTNADHDAPLFRHESFQSNEAQSSDDASNPSSTENTSSEDVIKTPSEQEQSQDDHESNHEPLFSHETGSADGDFDELNNGPLLSHETGLNGHISSSDEYEDELDAAPLLPHETGFSNYAGSKLATNSDYAEDDIAEPQHYMYGDDDDMDEYRARNFHPDDAPTFTHEEHPGSEHDFEAHDIPLLPHERDFAVSDNASAEEQPTFGYKTESPINMFGGTGRPSIFRKRTHSSSLPHSMPQTDAEDENLLDPSLERFPTSREHILDRVATIGLHLPEDQTMEDSTHSPVMSVLSQACSSVELVPVKSYTSLASVPESDEDDDEAVEDIHSLPSPLVSNFGSPSARFVRDPHATPLPDDSKRLEFFENHKSQAQVDHTMHSSEAESVAKTDGTRDLDLDKMQDVVSPSNKVVNPITPPLTPEKSSTPAAEDVAQVSEPTLRQRQAPKASSTSPPEADTLVDRRGSSSGAVKTAGHQHIVDPNETFLQTFLRVLGPVGRFLTACVGDRKRAGVTVFAVGVAAAAFYTVSAR